MDNKLKNVNTKKSFLITFSALLFANLVSINVKANIWDDIEKTISETIGDSIGGLNGKTGEKKYDIDITEDPTLYPSTFGSEIGWNSVFPKFQLGPMCGSVKNAKNLYRFSINLNSSKYSDEKTLFMAMLMDLVYQQTESIFTNSIENLNLKLFKRYHDEETGAEGVILQNHAGLFIVFAGSNDIQDWINNSQMKISYDEQLGGRVHTGFAKSFKSIWNSGMASDLESLEKEKSRPIFIAGHSLGGTSAVLAGLMAKQKSYTINGVYTFGQPRIGDSEFADKVSSILGDTYVRVTNSTDPIPHSPPTGLGSKGFTDIFRSSLLVDNQELIQLLDEAKYAHSTGNVLMLNPDTNAELVSLTTEDDIENDLTYWEATEDLFSHENDGKDKLTVSEMKKKIKNHFSANYLCRILSLLDDKINKSIEKKELAKIRKNNY